MGEHENGKKSVIFFCISNFLRVSAYVHSDLFAHRNCTPVPMYALETMHKRIVHIFVPPLRCKLLHIDARRRTMCKKSANCANLSWHWWGYAATARATRCFCLQRL